MSGATQQEVPTCWDCANAVRDALASVTGEHVVLEFDTVDDDHGAPAPCEHWDDQVGFVVAGDPPVLPFWSVTCCTACVSRAQDYASARTGLPAGPLQLFGAVS
ncbi:hypothetical protein ACWEQ0_23670 [Nocardia thailandica]